ncbi:MAG: NlpC/P60 family protein [Pseudomonadota bacterium]
MIARTRAAIVAETLDWVGTPYRHQQSAKGAGTDCLGLVRGVWRALYEYEPETPPPYTPDWAERADAEPLLEAATRRLVRSEAPPQPGDVLLFRMALRGPVKHAGILLEGERFAHAYSGRAVCVASLARWWRERLAAVFSFPGLQD